MESRSFLSLKMRMEPAGLQAPAPTKHFLGNFYTAGSGAQLQNCRTERAQGPSWPSLEEGVASGRLLPWGVRMNPRRRGPVPGMTEETAGPNFDLGSSQTASDRVDESLAEGKEERKAKSFHKQQQTPCT